MSLAPITTYRDPERRPPSRALLSRSPVLDVAEWITARWRDRTSHTTTVTADAAFHRAHDPHGLVARLEADALRGLHRDLHERPGRMVVAQEVRWYLGDGTVTGRVGGDAEYGDPVWRDEAIAYLSRKPDAVPDFGGLSRQVELLICVAEAVTIPMPPAWRP